MKKHGNQKYKNKADTYLSLRVNSDDKKAWQYEAKSMKLSLNEWVIKKLNK